MAILNQQRPDASLLQQTPQGSEGRGKRMHPVSNDLRRLVRALNRTLRDSEGNSSLIERFDELTKVIYCKVHDERDVVALASKKSAFQLQLRDTDASVAKRIRELFRRLIERRPDLFPERFSHLRLEDSTIRKLAEELGRFSLGGAPEDLKGLLYEEIIRNTFDKGENQQFFTPRAIVEFMVETLAHHWMGGSVTPPVEPGAFCSMLTSA